MRQTRARWQEASKIVKLVLQNLKSESARYEPQRHSTATNLALLFRVQKEPEAQQPQHPSSGGSFGAGSAAVVQPAAAARDSTAPVAPARLREAQRYMRYATAAYGHALMAAFGPAGCARAPSASALLKGSEAIDLEAICRHCGLEEADVILHQPHGDEANGCPGFFIAIDKSRETIVLSVRGTASLYDAVVHDLVCVAEPFAGGEAHAGMARATVALRQAVMPTLCKLAHEHRGFRVLLTGHSMGGGCAALLAVLLHHEASGGSPPQLQQTVSSSSSSSHGAASAPPPSSPTARATPGRVVAVTSGSKGDEEEGGCGPIALPSETRVNCLTFGSPPVYAPLSSLPASVTHAISAYKHHQDVVPSLSLAAVRTLLASLRALDAIPLPPKRRLAIITGHETPPPELVDAVSLASSSPNSKDEAPSTPFLAVPSSDLITLTRLGDTAPSRGAARKYEATASSVESFVSKGIRLTPSMVTDHSFGFYENAIAGAILLASGDAEGGGDREEREPEDDAAAKAV